LFARQSVLVFFTQFQRRANVDFELSEDQRMVQASVREFVAGESRARMSMTSKPNFRASN
jgi:hypothetical protein